MAENRIFGQILDADSGCVCAGGVCSENLYVMGVGRNLYVMCVGRKKKLVAARGADHCTAFAT